MHMKRSIGWATILMITLLAGCDLVKSPNDLITSPEQQDGMGIKEEQLQFIIKSFYKADVKSVDYFKARRDN